MATLVLSHYGYYGQYGEYASFGGHGHYGDNAFVATTMSRATLAVAFAVTVAGAAAVVAILVLAVAVPVVVASTWVLFFLRCPFWWGFSREAKRKTDAVLGGDNLRDTPQS